jgi:hypothetical protein
MRALENFADADLPEFLKTAATHPPLANGGHCPERFHYKHLLKAGGVIDGAVKERLKNKFKNAKDTVRRRNSRPNNTGLKPKATCKSSSARVQWASWPGSSSRAGFDFPIAIGHD